MNNMPEWYDEFFEEAEQTEAEKLFNELKVIALQSVKAEIKEELERLRADNKELKAVRSNWRAMQQEHKDALHSLEMAKRNAASEAKQKRFKEMMGDFEVAMYTVGYKYVEKPKCDKCNEHRRINYFTPRGKPTYERCECSEKPTIYVPNQSVLYEMNSRYGNFWYRSYEDGYDGMVLESSELKKEVYTNQPFEGLTRPQTVFRSEEDCQAYCDWLNEQEAVKDAAEAEEIPS
jgi:hypothetical protein